MRCATVGFLKCFQIITINWFWVLIHIFFIKIKIQNNYDNNYVSVNTEAVSDGDKGCDRAMIAMKCMVDNASKVHNELLFILIIFSNKQPLT